MPVAAPDPEATAGGGFVVGDLADAPATRQVLPREELMTRLTALMRSGEGCENVTVTEVSHIFPVDSRDGCNWSLAIVLDPAGVAPEVYALAYGAVIATARKSWNLE